MRRITRLILPLASIGMVVGLPATSRACLHGPGLCWWCSSGAASYGYSAAVVPTGIAPVVGATAPVGGLINPNAPIPASAPALAYPGAALAQPYSAPSYAAAPYGYAAPGYAPAGYYAASSYAAAGYAAPAYAAPGYAAPAYAAPGYAPGYAAPGYGPAAGQPSQAQGYLGAYDDAAPLAAVAPGMVLANSQLVASHIFQNLRKFGAGLDESGLLELAARLLGDATGIRPTGSDLDALRKIVRRFRSEMGGAGGTLPITGTGNTGASVTTDGSTVQVVAPPGVRVLVIQGGRGGGNAAADARGNQAIPSDDTDVPQRPTLPPSATPPARNPRSTPQDETPAAPAPAPAEPPAAPPEPASAK